MSDLNLNALSEQLLLAVKMGKETKDFQAQLAEVDLNELRSQLHSDDERKAFWINIYNAYFQILRTEKKIKAPEIYRHRLFHIASILLSLDDVEHGILRKYQYKYVPEELDSQFSSALIQSLIVDTLDYRIHFALNCGAESCPPIAFYKAALIDGQLNMGTQSFLEGESDFDAAKQLLHTSALLDWFNADFGGTNGIKRIYQEHLDKDISNYTIQFKEYSWKEELDNFV